MPDCACLRIAMICASLKRDVFREYPLSSILLRENSTFDPHHFGGDYRVAWACVNVLSGRVFRHVPNAAIQQFRCLAKPRAQAAAADDRRQPRQSAPSWRACQATRGERWIGRTAGGLHSKRPAVCDGTGSPLCIALTEGQRCDDDGARLR